MTITELFKHVGEENIEFQMLMRSLSGVTNGKKDSRITFFTSSEHGHDVATAAATDSKPKKIGMIVWLPADKLPKL